MKIETYIKENWDKLPKSTIDDIEIVIFECTHDSNGGYGHHSYEGYGVLVDGTIARAYSGGCSCYGSCGVDSPDSREFNGDPSKVDYYSLEVTFNNWG